MNINICLYVYLAALIHLKPHCCLYRLCFMPTLEANLETFGIHFLMDNYNRLKNFTKSNKFLIEVMAYWSPSKYLNKTKFNYECFFSKCNEICYACMGCDESQHDDKGYSTCYDKGLFKIKIFLGYLRFHLSKFYCISSLSSLSEMIILDVPLDRRN